MIRWEKIFYYYRESLELHIPHIKVISSVPLNYQELNNYNTLLRNG